MSPAYLATRDITGTIATYFKFGHQSLLKTKALQLHNYFDLVIRQTSTAPDAKDTQQIPPTRTTERYPSEPKYPTEPDTPPTPTPGVTGPPPGPGSGSAPTPGRYVDVDIPASMEQMVKEHGEAVYRVGYSVTREPALAEDVSQETLIKAWQSLSTFRGEAPLRSWILRIAHNTAVSLLRKRRDELRDPQDLPERHQYSVSTEISVENTIAMERLSEELNLLDDLSRSIVVLREVEGLSYSEISDLLEVPMPTIKTRLLRSRRRLAEALEGWRPQ